MNHFAALDFWGWRWSPIHQLSMLDLMLTEWRYRLYTHRFCTGWGSKVWGGEKKDVKMIQNVLAK